MIELGNTIVYRSDDGTIGFYWLCSVLPDEYVFFSWFSNPRYSSSSDYWRISRDWFNDRLTDGSIEVFKSLPLDEYGDDFERQARERNQVNL